MIDSTVLSVGYILSKMVTVAYLSIKTGNDA